MRLTVNLSLISIMGGIQNLIIFVNKMTWSVSRLRSVRSLITLKKYTILL